MTRTAADPGPYPRLDPDERDPQVPVEDLIEQAAAADGAGAPDEADEAREADLDRVAVDGSAGDGESPVARYAHAITTDPEAGEYDALEQAHPVYLDEDAYR